MNKYRTKHNVYWKAFSAIICRTVTEALERNNLTNIICNTVNSVSDVCSNFQGKHKVPLSTYDDEKHPTVSINDYGLSEINRALYCERDFDRFMTLFNDSVENISQKHINDTCLKIVDMEVYSIDEDKATKSKSVDGFDLIRLSSKYNVTILCKHNISLRFNCITEIFDFSHSKPCTIGYYLHGDESARDFEQVTMLHTNITMKSYSLLWFAKDIFRMSMQVGYNPKFTKRAKRLYDSLIMIIINALNNPAYRDTVINFTTMPHRFFNSNLLNLIKTTITEVLEENDRNGLLPYFQRINDIYATDFLNPVVIRFPQTPSNTVVLRL
jgi:hypothetical protein